ncbi:MAG: hypothetical protein K2M76_05485 [Muribaculaceae bacterium]|nr:hypothetical protein [Muribaculaceae bacterium]
MSTLHNDNVVWRLLRRNISATQLAGYAVANLVGLAIILTALQFYLDVSSVDNTATTSDYMSLTKSVAFISHGGSNGFTDEEIASLKAQPWVRHVAPFTASRFNVAAGVDFGGRSLGTLMFFEGLDEDMLDIKPDDWEFDPTGPIDIPIILPKDYLALYNFGFAASQGMPQVSERVISSVPVTLRLTGNGHDDRVRAHVAGFSSRINTVVVPADFITWANDRYSDHSADSRPERLMVQVSDPGNPAISAYLEDNGMQAGGDKEAAARMAYFFTILTSVVMAVGVVICALALFVLMLSLHLIMQKSRSQLRGLMMLGYSPRMVAMYYYKLTAMVNGSVLAIALIVMMCGRMYWSQLLEALDVHGAPVWTTAAAGLILIATVTAINFAMIRRWMLRIWYNR